MHNLFFILAVVLVEVGCSHVNDGMIRGRKAVDSVMDRAESIMDDDGIRCTGAYGGSEYANGHVTSYQYVDPNRCAKLDRDVGDNVAGGYMLHEFAEGYYSADIALHNKGGDPISLRNNYGIAHNRANAISGGDWTHASTSK